MSVSNFKFVSPGVFINEIDNSEIPATAQAIGPVVIGRSRKGLAMQPVTIESYEDFVDQFGQPVPGRAGGDIYRDGNFQTPMYGTYAAKAFLNANVAPVTYVRLLGQETTTGASAGGDAAAGWKTTNFMAQNGGAVDIAFGGAYGLWVFPSGSSSDLTQPPQIVDRASGSVGGASGTDDISSAGILAAVFYMDSGSISLKGPVRGDTAGVNATQDTIGQCVAIGTDSNNLFTAVYTDSEQVEHTVKFGFDDSEATFIRKRFNTNPQLLNASGTFYPTSQPIVLGETFEDNVRMYQHSGSSLIGQAMQGAIYGIQLSGSTTTTVAGVKQASREAVAGWFIGQDLSGDPASYKPAQMTKLFRLKGRGHGEWLNKNLKVSIEQIRASTSVATEYGTFSVVLREYHDTDKSKSVVERFDRCTLDPSSPNFVAKVLGDKYWEWNTTERRLVQYGEYDNRSSFVYVEMTEDVEAGASDPLLLPFGYFGPPTFAPIISGSGTNAASWLTGVFVSYSGSVANLGSSSVYVGNQGHQFLSGGSGPAATYGILTASLYWPVDNVRLSASDGSLSNPQRAYFGFMPTRTRTGIGASRPGTSFADWHRLLYQSFPSDPLAGQNPPLAATGHTGVNAWSYVFSMDDLRSGDGGVYYYESGSRRSQLSNVGSLTSYKTPLTAGYNQFTAPFWGGFDGFDIKKPDPVYNAGMASTSTEDDSYIFHTYKRAVDTVADPEFINMNVLTAPGLTQNTLTEAMIGVCEDRGDALALIDLPDVYLPAAEGYYNTKAQRIGTTPQNAATALQDRRIDSSYGATFYPWVQTRDSGTGRLLWIPPTVAMLGVFGHSEAASQIWFAPAGFNRGGLSDGAAGIPITNVTERLTSDNRDTLYESRINPIASFPNTGIVVFGQKTLQARQSALDRINVRRLVIYLKKQISILANQVLFEQNVQATWNNFKGLIEPLLSNTQTNQGITDYRLILDETTTTPDLIDQNILYAKIMVKPARAIEYIAIDFVIMSTGASFDD